MHGRIQPLMALSGNVVECGGHAVTAEDSPPGFLAYLACFHMTLALLCGVKTGQDARQVCVGLKQFLE